MNQAKSSCKISSGLIFKREALYFELLNESNASNDTILPGNNPRKTNKTSKMLFPEHSAFLIDLFDKSPSTALEEAKPKFCEVFLVFEISISGLYMPIREKCALSSKQATKYTADRDAPMTIQLRFKVATQWKAAGINFQKDCVFVDEASFYTQMCMIKKGRSSSCKIYI